MLREVLRPVAAVGVLACAASLLAGGTSSATAPTRPTYGPVVPSVVVPLVDARGPLLPRRPTAPVAAVAATVAVPGPSVRAPRVGPPVVVGPGSTPAQVREGQRLLNRAGAGLRVDGDWGPATTQAVRAVQARAGLPVDGRLGPATAAHLRRLPA